MSLIKTNPQLILEWHPEKNGDLRPEQVTGGSEKKVWWVCQKGHEWMKKILYRNIYHTGCPYCEDKTYILSSRALLTCCKVTVDVTNAHPYKKKMCITDHNLRNITDDLQRRTA